MSEQDCEQLTLFQEDSRASRSPSRESGSEKQMTVISGRKCSALLKNSGPLGLLAKMLLESSVWRSQLVSLKWKAEQLVAVQEKTTIVGYCHSGKECCSTVSYRTSKKPVMRSSHLLFRLAPSKRRTSGNESLLWVGTPTVLDHKRSKAFRQGRTPNPGELTMMLPTPTASMGMHGGPNQRDSNGRPGLQMAAMMWPTPTRREYKGARSPEALKAAGRSPNNTLGDAVMASDGGQLNPTWVEWLMGFPIGWTDLNH